MEAGCALSKDGAPSPGGLEQEENPVWKERLVVKPPLCLWWVWGHGPGDIELVAQGPPSIPHACTHCQSCGARPAPSPRPGHG